MSCCIFCCYIVPPPPCLVVGMLHHIITMLCCLFSTGKICWKWRGVIPIKVFYICFLYFNNLFQWCYCTDIIMCTEESRLDQLCVCVRRHCIPSKIPHTNQQPRSGVSNRNCYVSVNTVPVVFSLKESSTVFEVLSLTYMKSEATGRRLCVCIDQNLENSRVHTECYFDTEIIISVYFVEQLSYDCR